MRRSATGFNKSGRAGGWVTWASLSALAVLFACASVGAQRRGAGQPARAASATIFQVTAESEGVQVEPIVRVSGGRISEVPDAGQRPLNKQLAATVFKPGRQLAVIFGGARVGTATVKPKLPSGECARAAANVTLSAPAVKLGLNVFALATDSPTLGRATSARRAPTPEERAAVNKLAASVYQQKGVPAERAAAFDTINLTATDLDGDGQFELIGTFKLKRTADINDMLFLIAEPQGTEFRAGLANYEKVARADYADTNEEAFDNIGPAGFLFEVLLDQLDLDGDGTGEVFTRALSFEGVHFTIYHKQQGRWQRQQETSTYHCAY